MKKILSTLAVALLFAMAGSEAQAQCGSGQPPAGTVCAAPPSTAGVANYRLLSDGHIPSGINAAKIGGGSVSTTEYDRLDGITAFGQSLIDDADNTAAKTTLGLVIGTNVQAFDADLTTWAGLTPSANAQSLVTAANYAAMRALLDLEAGTDFYSIAGADAAFQPLDSDLTSWAAVARASGFDTLVATPSSSNARSFFTDEIGTGNLMFGLVSTMADDLGCAASQFVRRDAGDTAFECATIPGGGDALKADPLSQFASTTSAQLRGVLSDEVGTGAAMFGLISTMNDDLSCTGSQFVRRNSADTAFECADNLGKRTIAYPAGSLKPRATNGCAPGTFSGTNVEIAVCDFVDGTDKFAQITIPMPKSADESAGIDASFTWTTSTASNSVVWTLACVAISDDDVLDTAMGTLQSVTDAVTAANDQMTTSFTSTITPGNTWTEGDKLYCQLSRDADNGSDTHTGTARLLSMTVRYTVNSLRDD